MYIGLNIPLDRYMNLKTRMGPLSSSRLRVSIHVGVEIDSQTPYLGGVSSVFLEGEAMVSLTMYHAKQLSLSGTSLPARRLLTWRQWRDETYTGCRAQ